jgi:hypothetical protein
MRRSEASVTASPLLANPADPVNSSGIYYNKKDWNWQTSLTTRGAGLAAGPTDKVRAGLPAFVREGRWRPAGQPRFRGRGLAARCEILPAGSKPATLPASTSRSRATPT